MPIEIQLKVDGKGVGSELGKALESGEQKVGGLVLLPVLS
jgi:hypothetical protein